MQCSPVYSAGKVISVGMRQTFSGDLRNDFILSFLFASVAITELLRIISSSLCLKFEYVNKILPGAISHHSIRWWVAWRGGTEFDRLIQIYLMKPDEYLFDWLITHFPAMSLEDLYMCMTIYPQRGGTSLFHGSQRPLPTWRRTEGRSKSFSVISQFGH